MADENEKLLPKNSPVVANTQKKRARRINNRPLFIAFTAIGVVLIILGAVALGRSNNAKGEIAEKGGSSATPLVKTIIGADEGGMINPKEKPVNLPKPADVPTIPVVDNTAKTIPDRQDEAKKDIPNLRTPEPPKQNEDAKKARDKRLRQFEAAMDAPIKVQMEDMKSGSRSVNDEIARVERQLPALGNPGDSGYAERLAALKAATEGGSTGVDFSQRGDLSRMNQFGATGGNWKNAGTLETLASLFVIRTGSVIPATLISGINSDLPGQIVGQVAQDVYDTPTGKYLLIPQGSRLVGEYSSQVQYGQSRVFAVWQRVIFPDGKALDLGAMPGSTGAGYAGFRDRVNNHYIRIFGSAIMMSAILAGVEMTQNKQDYSQGSNQQRMSDALSESLGQVLGGVISEMLQKNMNIAPTLEIRPGYRLNVMLVKDLEFEAPYRSFDYLSK